MPTIVERKVGEYGNSLVVDLTTRGSPYAIPDGATLTLSGRRIDTAELVISAGPVFVLDVSTKTELGYQSTETVVQYDFADGELDAACTLSLEVAITPSGGKPTYSPDVLQGELLLVISPRVAA